MNHLHRVSTVLGDLHIPVPGTDFYKWSAAVSDALGISWSDAADIVGKVQDAYSEASAAQGAPYQAGTDQGKAIVAAISNATGLSVAPVGVALNALQTLASSGDVSNSTYNPNKYSLSATVKSALSTAAQDVKSAAEAVTPDAIQQAVAGLGSGVAGLGSLLQYLPVLVVGGLGVWGYVEYQKAKGRR
jgi:hypothetical protein